MKNIFKNSALALTFVAALAGNNLMAGKDEATAAGKAYAGLISQAVDAELAHAMDYKGNDGRGACGYYFNDGSERKPSTLGSLFKDSLDTKKSIPVALVGCPGRKIGGGNAKAGDRIADTGNLTEGTHYKKVTWWEFNKPAFEKKAAEDESSNPDVWAAKALLDAAEKKDQFVIVDAAFKALKGDKKMHNLPAVKAVADFKKGEHKDFDPAKADLETLKAFQAAYDAEKAAAVEAAVEAAKTAEQDASKKDAAGDKAKKDAEAKFEFAEKDGETGLAKLLGQVKTAIKDKSPASPASPASPGSPHDKNKNKDKDGNFFSGLFKGGFGSKAVQAGTVAVALVGVGSALGAENFVDKIWPDLTEEQREERIKKVKVIGAVAGALGATAAFIAFVGPTKYSPKWLREKSGLFGPKKPGATE